MYKLKKLTDMLIKIKNDPSIYLDKKPTVFEHMQTIKKFADLIEEIPDYELKTKAGHQSSLFQTEVPDHVSQKRYAL